MSRTSALACLAVALASTCLHAQRPVDVSDARLQGVRLYLPAREALAQINALNTTTPGDVEVLEEYSAYQPHTTFVRSIVWTTKDFVLIADFLQFVENKKLHEALVGIGLHPTFKTVAESDAWLYDFQTRLGPHTLTSPFSQGDTNHYYCQLNEKGDCDGKKPMLIVGRYFAMLTDCGYIESHNSVHLP